MRNVSNNSRLLPGNGTSCQVAWRILLVAIVLVASACPAAATDMSWRISPNQANAPRGYRTVELTVRHEGAPTSVIQGVSVRATDGGPVFLFAVTVAPGTERTARLVLPALRVQEQYRVRLLDRTDAGAAVVHERELSLSWPTEMLTTEQWIDPIAYQPWESDLPGWPERMRRNVFLTCVLICLALAGTLFIRSSVLRSATAGLILGLGCLVVCLPIRAVPLIAVRRVVSPSDSNGPSQTIHVVSCRRSSVWRGPAVSPVYAHWAQMLCDAAVIRPGESITAPIAPHQLRLFRGP